MVINLIEEKKQTEKFPTTIVVDLDGTLAYYEHFTPEIGKQLQHVADAIHIVRKEFPDVKFVVQTCRTNKVWGSQKSAQQVMRLRNWIVDNNLEFINVAADTGKAIGAIYLDDRSINVMPNRGNAKEIARAIKLRLTHGFGPLDRGLELASEHWDSYNSLFLLSFDVAFNTVKVARNYYINGFIDGYNYDGIGNMSIAEEHFTRCRLLPTTVTKLNKFNFTSAFVHGNGHGRKDRGEKYPW